MFYVYRITNKLNNKVYIGKSKDALKRFRIHLKIVKGGKEKYPRKFHAIHAAIAKYGVENFSFEILHEINTEVESFDLEMKEISFIDLDQRYNLSNGGEGNSGWKHTEKSKKKMSKSRKGKKFTLEHRTALSAAQFGELHSQYGKHQSISWKERKSKLTFFQVKEIKKMLFEHQTSGKEISRMFNVSEATISMIKSGKIWSDVIYHSESGLTSTAT